MNEYSVLPRKLVPWLLLGLLVAVVALSVGVLKATVATDRTSSDNHALRGRLDRLSGQVAELQRQTDVKSQQLRDAGIPESPLAAPSTGVRSTPPTATTTTTTTVTAPSSTTSTTSTSTTNTTPHRPTSTTSTTAGTCLAVICIP